MKKHLFTLASVVLAAGVVTFSSCKKEDTTAPSLTITGGNTVSQDLPSTAGQGTWTNPTATATDDQDGDVTSSITVTGTVDPNTAGTYTLTYSVADAAGNTASQTVTVNIVNHAAFLAGAYNGADTCQISGNFTYTANVTVSTTVNGSITINNFDAFGTNINITASVNSSNAITVSPQAVGTMGNILNGSGTATSGTTPTMYINFTWTDGTNTESCVEHYTHQ